MAALDASSANVEYILRNCCLFVYFGVHHRDAYKHISVYTYTYIHLCGVHSREECVTSPAISLSCKKESIRSLDVVRNGKFMFPTYTFPNTNFSPHSCESFSSASISDLSKLSSALSRAMVYLCSYKITLATSCKS